MENQIYNESCLDTMSRMEDNSIDLVVTSPPYDNLRTYDNDVDQSWGETVWKPIISELSRVIADGGVIVWVVGDATIDGSETGSSFKQALYFMECGLNLYDTMIWEKTGTPFPSQVRYNGVFEYMFVFAKGKPNTFNPLKKPNKTAGQYRKSRAFRQKDGGFSEGRELTTSDEGNRNNIWIIKNGFNKSSKDKYAFDHPAIFPENLAHDHIVSWSNEGDVVYDPFLGSGTTAKMSKITKRKYIGSEINEDYFKIALKRIEDAQEYFF